MINNQNSQIIQITAPCLRAKNTRRYSGSPKLPVHSGMRLSGIPINAIIMLEVPLFTCFALSIGIYIVLRFNSLNNS